MKENQINWYTFKGQLSENADLVLKFKYTDDKFVNAGYHITEIKRNVITSVDCGGTMNSWEEVVVQLLEPTRQNGVGFMKADKALSIIKLVENKIAINRLAIVKIEYGNAEFDTRQLTPAAFSIENGSLIIRLRPDTTQCKAVTRATNGCNKNSAVCC